MLMLACGNPANPPQLHRKPCLTRTIAKLKPQKTVDSLRKYQLLLNLWHRPTRLIKKRQPVENFPRYSQLPMKKIRANQLSTIRNPIIHRKPMIVLASASSARQKLLHAAGVSFITQVSSLDETTAKTTIQHLDAKSQCLLLAQRKAEAVSTLRPRDLIIGADQILEFEGKVFDKAASPADALQHLRQLQGQTHYLHSAAVTIANGNTAFQTVQTATLKMRNLSPDQISSYLEKTGPEILGAVGCYQIENLGIQLFDSIEGDYFTILGLPLLPLLRHLRETGHLTP